VPCKKIECEAIPDVDLYSIYTADVKVFCPPCSETICSVEPDVDIYSLQGLLPRPLPPVVPVNNAFSNDAVYFQMDCADGEVISFSGTLPNWISLDTDNNRLIGAAGTYRSVSKLNANSEAQAALNVFGNAQETSGNLTCEPVSACPVLTYTTAVPQKSFDLVGSNDPTSGRLLASSGVNPTQTIAFYDVNATPSSLNTDVVTYPVTGANYFWASGGRWFVMNLAVQSYFRIYSKDGVYLNDIASPESPPGVARSVYHTSYDYDSGVMYSAYAASGNTHIISMSDTAILTDVNIGGSVTATTQLYYCPSPKCLFMTNSATDAIWEAFALPGGASLGTVDFGATAYSVLVACYATNTGKMYFLGYDLSDNTKHLFEVNPTTLSIDFDYHLADTIGGEKVQYNSLTGKIIVGSNYNSALTDIVIIDPLTRTIVCTISTAGFGDGQSGIAIDGKTGHCFITDPTIAGAGKIYTYV